MHGFTNFKARFKQPSTVGLFINGDLELTRKETVVAFGLCGFVSSGSGQGQVAGCCEYCGYINREFLDHLSDYKLLQKTLLLGVNS